MPLCMGCLNEIPIEDATCSHCGFDNSKEQTAPFLPYGTILASKYVIAKNLDTNGESTRYLGYDNSSGRVVTIREFLPIGLFDRKKGSKKIIIDPGKEDMYEDAISLFRDYYKNLTTLSDMSAMVAIVDMFDENNTSYVVEESEELVPFSEFLDHNDGMIDWEEARPLFMPIISLLENIHKTGYGHYAVSPTNLFVTTDGKLKLSGFSTEYERKRGTILKSQLYSGCAAPEQYKDNMTLDEAADIYGFTATLFNALTGTLPANAKERIKDPKLLISTNTVKRIPPHVVSALANGLQVKKSERISDFDELRSQLSAASTVQAIQDEISRTASMTPIKNEDIKKKKAAPSAIAIVATIVALLIFSSAGLWWVSLDPMSGVFKKSTYPATQKASEEEWTGAVFDDYVGKPYDTVVKEASLLGITIKKAADPGYSDTAEKGTVLSQQPEAGSPINAESPIVYVQVCNGPQLIKLPEAAKKSLTSVAEKLTDAGFVVVQEQEYSDDVKSNYVIDYKNYKAGDKVDNGSEIVLRVSKGKKPAETKSEE